MATLTISSVVRSGLKRALAAVAAGGDQVSNTGADNKGRVFIEIANGSAAARTLTIVTPTGANVDGLTLPDRTVTLSGNSTYLVGPFTPTYTNASGFVAFTYSDSGNSLTVQALRLPKAANA